MPIHVALNHVTHYRYDRPIELGPQVVRLRPAPHSRTRILSYSMRVLPAKHFVNWQQDPQSNHLARLVFPDRTSEFRVEVDLLAEMAVFNPFDFFLEPEAEEFPFAYEPELARELAPFLEKLPATPRFVEYLTSIDLTKRRTTGFLVALNQRLQRDVAYLIRMEPGVQTPEHTLVSGAGSCRDSAWLLVQLLRHLGLAARFVSGYLIQLKADVKSLDGPSGASADFTDLHAWCEVYLPGAGWVGLDPTSGLFAGEGHIPLACSPEPSSAAPISGLLEPCQTTFEHRMSVERIWESPRVTLPYGEAQWAAIDALGRQVDADLLRHDVRLTQGGEPTFVSVDDRDGAEWSTEAMGPTKKVLSEALLEKLRARHGAGTLVHHGQGKWYPGEQLPRWSLNLFWRRDGVPIWRDAALLAPESAEGADAATVDDARDLLLALAERLRVAGRHVFAAYEDTWYQLWREQKLPINVDPLDAKLADPAERERLRRVFLRGLDAAVGYALPLGRDPERPDRWQSTPWYLRGDRCLLVPGDSPIGARLPLDALPWARAADRPAPFDRDSEDATGELPPHPDAPDDAVDGEATWHSHAEPPGSGADAFEHETPAGTRDGPEDGDAAAEASEAAPTADADPPPPEVGSSAAFVTRTAIAAEPRDGRLHVNLPPIARREDWLALVAALEPAARAIGRPVVLEGYEPPKDPRLLLLRVTPDPGVIEVNVDPVASWPDLVAQTTHLYDAARETRLSTEKFLLDGRHTGTGGGNHVVLGGATPADSPFLRRPDLLASMVGYWLNHPSLSYVFSGLFVGPTSQAPRIDEARNDAVHEIEIAFAELHRAEAVQRAEGLGWTPPWLVDRLLRNLLVDVTGNTHRAEFCIDKLFSPDGPTGRLGLLEMRAFEMPPHARMSLVQQVLLRALVARFWVEPYRPTRLARWANELHDRFLLPHHLREDLADVVAELRAFGYPVELAWFEPHLEFRFPLLGEAEAAPVGLELRLALEPWHVLGEESGGGGTARFVDSSLERIQVKAKGLVAGRHVVACNGRRLPLVPTGTAGEAVCGVRFRAWTAPSSLHPTIGAHAPLVLDVVDTWNGRSIGGCQYHVSHPGGVNHTVFPVNALEAEARRRARFFTTGHTPGALAPPAEAPNPEFPHTLDLRRPAA